MVNDLLASYLQNRKKFVLIDGIRSDMACIKIGVPQGSILSPLLYILYVNDISNAVSCIPRVYADDTCLVVHDRKMNILQEKISINIRDLKVWLDANKLTLNLTKTACLLIFPFSKCQTHAFNPTVDNELINVVISYKYLKQLC